MDPPACPGVGVRLDSGMDLFFRRDDALLPGKSTRLHVTIAMASNLPDSCSYAHSLIELRGARGAQGCPKGRLRDGRMVGLMMRLLKSIAFSLPNGWLL